MKSASSPYTTCAISYQKQSKQVGFETALRNPTVQACHAKSRKTTRSIGMMSATATLATVYPVIA